MHHSPPGRWLYGGVLGVVPRLPWEHPAMLPRRDESWADDVYSRNRIPAQLCMDIEVSPCIIMGKMVGCPPSRASGTMPSAPREARHPQVTRTT